MRALVLLFPILLAGPANACLNDIDSDTLANQANAFPDTLRVITGRFERNPPLYYEMRIARDQQTLKAKPRQFNLYDDVAVAYDRIHQDAAAIKIIEQKRSLLPAFDPRNSEMKEAWYRYFANAGTFHVHHWLASGAKVASIAEMKLARNYIAHAIEIKPNAHFGRERYQLMAMDWIVAIRLKKGGMGLTLGQWIAKKDKWGDEFFTSDPEKQLKAAQGLCGLVVLGGAWESPDVFEAIGFALSKKDSVTLRALAIQRCWELIRDGKKSFSSTVTNSKGSQWELPQPTDLGSGGGINYVNYEALQNLFPKLHAEADDWSAERTAYMLARLQKGDHPDTDSHFWDDWRPADPPSLNIDWYNQKTDTYNGEWVPRSQLPVFLFMAALISLPFLLFARQMFLKFKAARFKRIQ